jgi:hypothetical protein
MEVGPAKVSGNTDNSTPNETDGELTNQRSIVGNPREYP